MPSAGLSSLCVSWTSQLFQTSLKNHQTCLPFFPFPSYLPPSPSQPIVDLSPIRRSASSLTQKNQYEDGLRTYNLERTEIAHSSAGPSQSQSQSQERAHHHHHHHRCHRRRDKDREKKQKSLDRVTTVQPSSTVGE